MTPGDQFLMERMGELAWHPEQWIWEAFPWGEPGPLAGHKPRSWQLKMMQDLGEAIRARGFDGHTPVDPIQMAVSSGHGIGKSTQSSFLILFLMSTRPRAKGTVTANTSGQLKTKTWGELKKWLDLFIARHWFYYSNSLGNMSLKHVDSPDQWRCDAYTCREENSESFAGQHSADGASFYLFDEASAVPDVIYEVSDGGLTDGEPFRFLFGNPTRNTGRFTEAIWGRQRDRFIRYKIDSRTVEGTNHAYLQSICDDWGEESDYARVRVRGERPSMSSMQFIGNDIAADARTRPGVSFAHDALIVGADIARFGDDKTVIAFRRGRDANIHKWITLRGSDTMTVAGLLAEIWQGSHHTDRLRPDAMIVDGGGLGAGVVDRLRQLNVPVLEYQGGAKSPEQKCYNMRAASWWRMKEWLPTGTVPDSEDLTSDMTGIEYGFGTGSTDGQIKLERKEDMKKRGLASPDHADALAMTFSFPVMPRSLSGIGQRESVHEFDPI